MKSLRLMLAFATISLLIASSVMAVEEEEPTITIEDVVTNQEIPV